MAARHYIACDLGAESGRVMLGTLDDGKVSLEEIHRFPNGAIVVNASLRWDVLRLFDELKTGVRKVAARGVKVEGLSCDSWGVDYVWLKDNEPFLTAPYHYRDTRTDGGFEPERIQLNEDTLWAGGPYDPNITNALATLRSDAQTIHHSR